VPGFAVFERPSLRLNYIAIFRNIYRVSIKSFPDYKHLLQENYMEYKHIFLPLLKLVSKILCHVFIVMLYCYVCIPRIFLVINIFNQGKNLC